MIWFACRQCGKRQGRPDEEAGTLIFCNCGTSNRVPWESSVPEPDPQPVGWVGSSEPTEAQGANAPRSDAQGVDTPRSASDLPPIPFADDPPRSRSQAGERGRTTIRERNPAYCLNHQDLVKQQSCVDCQQGFCDDCVVAFQGHVLCGPCKNFRIRKMHQPADLSLMALFSPILALAGGFVGLLISAIAIQIGAPALGFLSVTPQLGALGLGVAAMRRIENVPFLKGRSLAMTGIVAAVVGAVLNCLLTIILKRSRE